MNALLKTSAAVCLLLPLLGPAAGQGTRYRKPIRIPDIPGYLTLKCDLHIHTVFSDGSVWPDVRSEEAWREGLDAIAITDHIEYLPHKKDLPPNHDRSYQIAHPHGQRLDLIVIRGSEVTRDMPPGHLNAIFLDQVAPLETDAWGDAVQAASDQKAFIFWNHPGWQGQQPDGVARWYPEHEELVEKGMLHGIEVVNFRDYYPEAHRWCLEKKLTMLSNSDIHEPLNMDFEPRQGDHRPLTLVFATERSLEAIREALFDRRTAVYSGNLLIGEERFLRPIFERSIEVKNPSLEIQGDKTAYVRIENRSQIDFELVRRADLEEVALPKRLTLRGESTVLLEVKGVSKDRSGRSRLTIPFTVENLKIGPDVPMPVQMPLEVSFVAEQAWLSQLDQLAFREKLAEIQKVSDAPLQIQRSRVPALVQLLSDPDQTLRLAAAREIGEIRAEEALPALIANLSRPHGEEGMGYAEAAAAFGRQALPLLERALKSQDWLVRDRACTSIRLIQRDLYLDGECKTRKPDAPQSGERP